MIEREVERKTFIQGRFKGKYEGTWDAPKSDGAHENFYDIVVLQGQIFANQANADLRKWSEGEHRRFKKVEKFLTSLPHG